MAERYSGFAAVYDRLMYDTDYEGWTALIHSVISERTAGRDILECACGTGRFSLLLDGLGYDVVATDISGEMLDAAQERAVGAGRRIMFAQADMAALPFENRFDGIVCACDGVNYLDDMQLAAFFDGAARALRPGGALIFDVSNEKRLRDDFGDGVFCDEEDDSAYILKSAYEDGVCFLDLTLFIREGELYRRWEESHALYLHGTERIKGLLEEAGFHRIQVTQGENTPITAGRTLFAANRIR